SATSGALFQVDASGGWDVVGQHTWLSTGSYPITISLSDDGGQTATATPTASVQAPQVSPHPPQGHPFTGVVATLPGASAPPPRATITWGDGHSSQGTIAPAAGGGWTVSGNNTYAEEGLFAVSVSAQLSGGGTLTAQGVAQVQDAALAAQGTDFSYVLGQTP